MEPMTPKIDETNVEDLVNNIEAVLFDCDGVLWAGSNVIDNVPETLQKLRALGKKVFFVTNNSTKHREEYRVKLNKLGFQAELDEIGCTSYLAAQYLKSLNFSHKVYLIGNKGIAEELRLAGIAYAGLGPDPMISDVAELIKGGISLDPDIKAVVVGFDEHLSYRKLYTAANYLKDPSIPFIATNCDEVLPLDHDLVVPGTGTMVTAVKTCSQREPIVMGKPSTGMFEMIQKSHNLVPEKCLMVGDNAKTDIVFGKRNGLKTLLVLTGVTTIEQLKEREETGQVDYVPDFYLPSLGHLLPLLDSIHRRHQGEQ